MTHDELLAKLLISDKTDVHETLRLWQAALYAVVELHTPMLTGKWCKGCSQSSSEFTPKLVHHMEFAAAVYVAFPCPTIQAIQKELE